MTSSELESENGTELTRALNELKLRDEEVAKLKCLKDRVESEVEDLTASLFEEANNMVYEAKLSRSRIEKELYEANLKIDMMQAEIQALKILVIHSTPSNHNNNAKRAVNHSHSPLHTPNGHHNGHHSGNDGILSAKSLLARSNNHNQNSTGMSTTLPPKSPSNYELGGNHVHTINCNTSNDAAHFGTNHSFLDDSDELSYDIGEVDPIFHDEFLEWKKSPTLDPIDSQFIKRIYNEEIYPVFNFTNKELTSKALRAIEDNSIIIEVIGGKSTFPKKCALLEAPRSCKYRMKLADDWFNISTLCRNRITAVCDLFCYLRYIQLGLVKSSFRDVFWEIMRRRRNIALSKLGFDIL